MHPLTKRKPLILNRQKFGSFYFQDNILLNSFQNFSVFFFLFNLLIFYHFPTIRLIIFCSVVFLSESTTLLEMKILSESVTIEIAFSVASQYVDYSEENLHVRYSLLPQSEGIGFFGVHYYS